MIWKRYRPEIAEKDQENYGKGFMECAICNLVCPYGKNIDEKIIPSKRELI